jgi:hypothetical protein
MVGVDGGGVKTEMAAMEHCDASWRPEGRGEVSYRLETYYDDAVAACLADFSSQGSMPASRSLSFKSSLSESLIKPFAISDRSPVCWGSKLLYSSNRTFAISLGVKDTSAKNIKPFSPI